MYTQPSQSNSTYIYHCTATSIQDGICCCWIVADTEYARIGVVVQTSPPWRPPRFSQMKNYFHFISRNGESRLFKWKYHFPPVCADTSICRSFDGVLLPSIFQVNFCQRCKRGGKNFNEKWRGKFCSEEKWAIKLPEWWWKEVRVT